LFIFPLTFYQNECVRRIDIWGELNNTNLKYIVKSEY